MPRNLCNLLERRDESGQTYYEVRAEEMCGNQGGICPMFTSGSWARSVTIDARSWWMIAGGDGGGQVFADGTGPGTDGLSTNQSGIRVPSLKKWALIARWCAIDGNKVDYLTDWIYIGRGGTFSVPIPSAIIPKPGSGGFDYTPKVRLMYACNDDDFGDNAGWLHVYESWNP